jgi:hypothetical protein
MTERKPVSETLQFEKILKAVLNAKHNLIAVVNGTSGT